MWWSLKILRDTSEGGGRTFAEVNPLVELHPQAAEEGRPLRQGFPGLKGSALGLFPG
jgi:hypothetical protein